MKSPVHSDVTMQLRELEQGLSVYECPKSGGLWIPLPAYLAWQEQHRADPKEPLPDQLVPALQDDARNRPLLCPESGRLLIRYPVGHGLAFLIEHSPATGGVWLDKGEWDALKSKGLHLSLNQIFTAAYQREIRSSEYLQRLTNDFRERIGAADFEKVEEFGVWLAKHPKRGDIWCHLHDNLGPLINTHEG